MWSKATRGVLDAIGMADFLGETELRNLRVPVQLLWGESDRLLPEGTLPFLRGALPAARVTLLANCGHVPHLEQPRALARALLQAVS